MQTKLKRNNRSDEAELDGSEPFGGFTNTGTGFLIEW